MEHSTHPDVAVMRLRESYYKLFKKKTCPIDDPNDEAETHIDHVVDKDVQSMLLPLNLMQTIIFLPKYSIKYDFIRSNNVKTKLISFVATILRVCQYAFRSAHVMSFPTRYLYFHCLVLLDTLFYPSVFVIIYVLNIVYVKINIAIVLSFQEFHRLLSTTKIIKSITKWNWISVILIFIHHFIFFTTVLHFGIAWFVVLCNFILVIFDVNILYAIRLINCFETYVNYSHSILFKAQSHDIDKHICKFCAYNKILECYILFKKFYEPLVSIFLLPFYCLLHEADTFIKNLLVLLLLYYFYC